MSDKKSSDELFHSEDEVEVFTHQLDMNGMVISSVTDGVVIGITADKLQELLDIARANEDGKVIIFIKGDDEPLN